MCITQILREINFDESRRSKIIIFVILGALHFVNLLDFSLQKVQKFIKSKIRSNSESCITRVKMADYALLGSAKLISRKI